MMRQMVRIACCFVFLSVAVAGKDRAWLSCKVDKVERVQSRLMDNNALVRYSVRCGSDLYILEHARGTYYSAPPKAIAEPGNDVSLSVEGSKHAILKSSEEKKMRLVSVAQELHR